MISKTLRKNPHFYAVILAGGSGTRFWPLSREGRPKQFLNILGKRDLFTAALERAAGAVPPGRILIVGSVSHKKELYRRARRSRVPEKNILLEPSGKNTAPAVCWAASELIKRDPDAVMVLLPADHLITRQRNFYRCLGQAVQLAGESFLVTMGITPTGPETGYGYLKTQKKGKGKKRYLKVERFVEKPSSGRAKRFLKNKNYLWNSGMFIWRADVILEEFRRSLPKVYRFFIKSKTAAGRQWPALPSVSVDHGILEKSRKVAAVAARDIGWSDVGSWQALAELQAGKSKDNVKKGPIVTVDCEGTLIRSQGRLVAAIGLKDLVIIDSPDAVLVCPRGRAQDVRKIITKIKKSGHKHLL